MFLTGPERGTLGGQPSNMRATPRFGRGEREGRGSREAQVPTAQRGRKRAFTGPSPSALRLLELPDASLGALGDANEARERVSGRALDAPFEVEVRPMCDPGTSDFAQHLRPAHPHPG